VSSEPGPTGQGLHCGIVPILNGFEAIVGQDPHHTAIITLLKKSVCIGDFPDCAASFGAMTIAGPILIPARGGTHEGPTHHL
jgi:hypothetical protein